MGTILASAIIDRAEIVLHDNTSIRWPSSESLGWLNQAQREIVLLKPDAYPQNESVQCAAGTKQSIPASGTVLIKVTRNMGVDGNTPGNVIRITDVRCLDDNIPDWHSEAAADEVEHYVFDPMDPTHFYIYPQCTNYVEIVYAKAPTEIATVSSAITLADIYEPALFNYLLYRSYAKDADYASNFQRMAQARSEFLQLLGRQDLMEAIYNPNLSKDQKLAAMAAAPQG